LLCSDLQLWTRVDTGLYLASSAIRDTRDLNFMEADTKWDKAARIVPWEPAYPAIAAEAMLDLLPDAKSERDSQQLKMLAVGYFRAAVEAAPNDPWFRQNLAVLLLNIDPKESEFHSEQAVRLLPRNDGNYTYYTLGLAYLKQGKLSKAINAFVLESLGNPIFLIGRMWEKEPLLSMKHAVISKSLESYRQILSTTNPVSNQYRWLHEQLIVLSWWYGYPIAAEDQETSSPLIRALLVANDNPEEALDLIDIHIKESGYSDDIHLLQARLSPQQYLPSLLEKLDGTDVEEATLKESLESEQSTQSWLSEVAENVKEQVRYGSIFAYRTLVANYIQTILNPGDIQVPLLPSGIGLFPKAPREYPQLDYYMLDIRTKQLEIE
ncbi:MAG: hypothetical protein WA949_23725, partial [Phormidesmis sp.]